MRKKIFQWLGREFVALSREGRSETSASDQMQQIFRSFEGGLQGSGLSLENTVRTRLWARDQESRHQASDVRFKVLSGKARASSTSFISNAYFNSEARVGMDLIAMRPTKSDLEKKVVEYDSPKRPCRYVIYDSLVFLTGEEAETDLQPPNLAGQLNNILSVLGDSLVHAGTSWGHVVKISSFLQRAQKTETLKGLFEKNLKEKISQMEYVSVDGFAIQEGVPGGGEGILEVEVTAKIK